MCFPATPLSADILNLGRLRLICRQKDLTIYQDGSSDHINQLFKGLGDTMHGQSFSDMKHFKSLHGDRKHFSDR